MEIRDTFADQPQFIVLLPKLNQIKQRSILASLRNHHSYSSKVFSKVFAFYLGNLRPAASPIGTMSFRNEWHF